MSDELLFFLCVFFILNFFFFFFFFFQAEDGIRDKLVTGVQTCALPILRGAASILARPDQDSLYAIGRLAPGATSAAVEARATAELQNWLTAQTFLNDDQRKRIGGQRVQV